MKSRYSLDLKLKKNVLHAVSPQEIINAAQKMPLPELEEFAKTTHNRRQCLGKFVRQSLKTVMENNFIRITARIALCFAFFAFLASPATAQTKRKADSENPVEIASDKSRRTIKKIGVFTDMRFTAEHQSGYSVELWQEQGRVFGLFSASRGLIGDTPVGLLENAAFDAKTGNLTFRARLSTAVTLGQNNKEAPTRDRFEFKGVLKNRKITGILTHRDDSTAPAVDSKKKITLTLSKSETAAMSEAKSYDEWRKAADEILAARGPKW